MIFLLKRFTFRRLRLDLAKTTLASSGVSLGIAVLLAIHLANASVMSAFQETINAVAGHAELSITAGSAGFDERLFSLIVRCPGVENAAPIVEGIAPITAVSQPGLQHVPRSLAAASSWLYIIGIDPLRYRAFQSASGQNAGTLDGSNVRFLTDPTAAEVTPALAAAEHLRVGSRLTIRVGAGRKTIHVIRVLPTDPLSKAYGGRTAIMDIAAAQETLGRVGKLDQALVITSGGRPLDVLDKLSKVLPRGINIQRPSARSGVVDRMIGAFRLNLEALSLIALFVGMFLIYNTLSSTVVRTRGELGILRGLGCSRRRLFGLVLSEAAAIGAAGSALGLALGWLLGAGLLGLVAGTVTSLYVRVQPAHLESPVSTLVLVWLLGVTAALLSALPPALEAAYIDPAAVIRQRSVLRFAAGRRRTFVKGAASAALLAVVFSAAALSLRLPFLSFAAALAIMVCLSLLSPAACTAAFLVVGFLAARRKGAPIRIGAAFLQESLDRVWVVVGALSASIAMLVGLSVMVSSFRQTVNIWVAQTVRGDVYISPAAASVSGSRAVLPAGVVTGVSRLPGVALVDRYRYILLRGQDEDVTLGARSPEVIKARPAYQIREGSTAAAIEALSRGDAALISEPYADRHHLRRGAVLKLDSPYGRASLRVAGVFEDFTSDQGVILIARPEFIKLWHDESVNSLALYAQPGVSDASIAREAAAAFPHSDLQIRTNAGLRTEILRIFDQTFRVTYVLELVAFIVALLGIANTLMTMTVQNSRQLATIRALGATRSQTAGIIMVEASVIAAVAWVLGCVCGIALAAELVWVSLPGFFHWTIGYTLGPGIFVESLALIMPASLAAALAPAYAARRIEVSRAMRTE